MFFQGVFFPRILCFSATFFSNGQNKSAFIGAYVGEVTAMRFPDLQGACTEYLEIALRPMKEGNEIWGVVHEKQIPLVKKSVWAVFQVNTK